MQKTATFVLAGLLLAGCGTSPLAGPKASVSDSLSAQGAKLNPTSYEQITFETLNRLVLDPKFAATKDGKSLQVKCLAEASPPGAQYAGWNAFLKAEAKGPENVRAESLLRRLPTLASRDAKFAWLEERGIAVSWMDHKPLPPVTVFFRVRAQKTLEDALVKTIDVKGIQAPSGKVFTF
ncbi:MAG: hypothetical protein VKS61_00240 [Candidatus Sericytochromatia bacterium]|nr:hypothetical protein [Candidatus Sericytochromatia bacterium]